MDLNLQGDLIFGVNFWIEKLRLEGFYLNLRAVCCILFFSFVSIVMKFISEPLVTYVEQHGWA